MLVHLCTALAAMAQQRHTAIWRAVPLLGLTLFLLGACQTFSPDGGMDAVANIAGAELNKDVAALRTPEQAAAARARVNGLLRKPLNADAAVQIALLNNAGLQAAYNELGIAEAVMVEASLPPGPSFSLSTISTAVELDIERRIVANILALATLPARAEIANDRYRQAQLKAAHETLRVAAQTRRDFYEAVASRQIIGFLIQAVEAARITAELGRRLGETGAMNKLDQTRGQVFHAEISAQLVTVRQRADSERERLMRAMGLSGSDLAFRLPNNLPALPPRVRNSSSIETEAIKRRVDLQIARIEVEALAKTYGLTRAVRFVNLLEVSGISRTQRESSGTRGSGGGVEVEFQIPIFDFGEARLRQANEAYMEAVNRLTEKAINVRSQARDAYRVYRSTYDVARRYRDEVVPLRKVISDEMLLRYGAMQVDVFSLLTEARQRVTANLAAIEAQREFWVADGNLKAAIIGGGGTEERRTGESRSSPIAPE
jgi:outer membrane protein TolC